MTEPSTQAPELVVERRINATPPTVFSFFTDRDRWLSWQGEEAEIDPRPGGVFRMNVREGNVAAGHFVTVDPYHRITFTWGWEAPDTLLPPGTSTVDITLRPDGGATLLTLTHRGLPLDLFQSHGIGWNHYVDRLSVRAEGGDPGPDEGAEE
ncbi:MAG TPA: SRPBCC family protein [Kutzneria sp.]|jgi:uncharacterized protein YndB with AHSA1/START domain